MTFPKSCDIIRTCNERVIHEIHVKHECTWKSTHYIRTFELKVPIHKKKGGINFMLDTLIIINIAVSIYLSIELGKRRSYEERIEHYQTRPHIRVKERDYTDYDKRIEEIKDELASLHKWDGVTENGGILAKGVYNLEHSTVNLENELFPSVEEEKQIGYNEIAK